MVQDTLQNLKGERTTILVTHVCIIYAEGLFQKLI
jgi:hypothetical protein